MPCDLQIGYTVNNCLKLTGGVKRIWFALYENLDQTNGAKFAKTANVVTTLVLNTGKQWRLYSLDKEMGSFKDSHNRSQDSGSITYAPTVNFTIKGLETTVKDELHTMTKNNILAIVESRAGKYWLLGLDGGLNVSTVDTDGGTKVEDFNGHKVTLVGKSDIGMSEVDATLITSALTTPAV